MKNEKKLQRMIPVTEEKSLFDKRVNTHNDLSHAKKLIMFKSRPN